MALVGHPVLGDTKYTYGYAKRHPDAAILLHSLEAEQAMTTPFGVCSEHPGHQTTKARYTRIPSSFLLSGFHIFCHSLTQNIMHTFFVFRCFLHVSLQGSVWALGIDSRAC